MNNKPKMKTQQNLARLSKIIVSGFGIGYSPWAPGTLASIATVLVAYFGIFPSMTAYWIVTPVWRYILLCGGSVAVGLVLIPVAAGSGLRDDPSWIVFDEWVGMLIALIAIPYEPLFFLAALLIFRFFDIVKPYPISALEKLPGAWGIMLDDVGAGIATLSILHITHLALKTAVTF